MRNPAAYEKLTAEIDTAVADGALSMPVAYVEAVKLPYLKACINEGHASAPERRAHNAATRLGRRSDHLRL